MTPDPSGAHPAKSAEAMNIGEIRVTRVKRPLKGFVILQRLGREKWAQAWGLTDIEAYRRLQYLIDKERQRA